MSRLEQVDWVPIGIFDLDLSPAWTSLNLIPKLHARVLQRHRCAPANLSRGGPVDSIRPAAGIRRWASDEIQMPPGH
jgi:hypothetical protein